MGAFFTFCECEVALLPNKEQEMEAFLNVADQVALVTLLLSGASYVCLKVWALWRSECTCSRCGVMNWRIIGRDWCDNCRWDGEYSCD